MSTVMKEFLKARKCIREMKAEASLGTGDEEHIDSLLHKYHQLVRSAEANIFCPPDIIEGYFLKRIAVYHEVLDKYGRAPRALEELRDELLERSRQRNAEAEAEWRRAFEYHCSDSEIPLYYVRPDGYVRHSGHYTPVSQVPLLSHIVDRPELVSATKEWLDAQKSSFGLSTTHKQRLALTNYCFRGYGSIWEAFNTGKVKEHADATAIDEAFKHPRLRKHTLPRGMCLFEGQGFHEQENDIARLNLRDDQLPFRLHSHRPRSTSLVPNIALLYTGGSIKEYKPFEPPVHEWHAISPKGAAEFGDWANCHRLTIAGGCCIRYYIQSGVPAMSMWTTADHIQEEAEVMLPPGCTIEIFKIDRDVEMSTRRIDNAGIRVPQCFYDVYHANLTWENV